MACKKKMKKSKKAKPSAVRGLFSFLKGLIGL